MLYPANVRRHLFFTVLILLIIPSGSFGAEPIPARVVGVSDGDTITAVINGEQVKIRLYGIDAPEKAQPFGQVSATAMQHFTTGRNITVQAIDRDRYGRTVGMVLADGVNLNEAMVRSGNAWVYRQYCTQPFCSDWLRHQEAAKAKHQGLWQGNNPTPPWEWRHGGGIGQQEIANLASKPDVSGAFIGNVNSRKFHAPGCQHANCTNCTATFTSREKAISAGYVPCKVCNP